MLFQGSSLHCPKGGGESFFEEALALMIQFLEFFLKIRPCQVQGQPLINPCIGDNSD